MTCHRRRRLQTDHILKAVHGQVGEATGIHTIGGTGDIGLDERPFEYDLDGFHLNGTVRQLHRQLGATIGQHDDSRRRHRPVADHRGLHIIGTGPNVEDPIETGGVGGGTLAGADDEDIGADEWLAVGGIGDDTLETAGDTRHERHGPQQGHQCQCFAGSCSHQDSPRRLQAARWPSSPSVPMGSRTGID